MLDILASLLLILLALVVAVSFFCRRNSFDFLSSRIDEIGGSSLLNKRLIEMGYWFIQPIGKRLAKTSISPNTLSWSGFFLALLGGCLLAQGRFGLASVLLIGSGLLDMLDGFVARLSFRSLNSGVVLDSTLDRYTDAFLLFGAAYYYREWPILLILSLLALQGSFMVSYSTAKAEAIHVTPPRGNMKRGERWVWLLGGILLSSFSSYWTVRQSDISSEVLKTAPLALSIALVAICSNISAALRLRAIFKAAN